MLALPAPRRVADATTTPNQKRTPEKFPPAYIQILKKRSAVLRLKSMWKAAARAGHDLDDWLLAEAEVLDTAVTVAA